MSLATADVARMLVALALLVTLAHAIGYLFTRLRQPAVVGEILGGLLLGPTVLGSIAPEVAASLVPQSGATGIVVGGVSYLGLLLLMFLTGGELNTHAAREERKAVAAITALGLLPPFGVGLLVAQVLDHTDFSGPHGSSVTFVLIFGIATAVTSIPVISRIMMDLGILDTAFARIVLTVAVLEDVFLYVVLAVALGIAQAQSESTYGLWALIGVDSVAWASTYYVAAALLFFAVMLAWGARLVQWLSARPAGWLSTYSPAALLLVLLMMAGLACLGLGINPIFGTLMAGISAARSARADGDAQHARLAWDGLKRVSLALFIPVYFATVGLQLDLARHFDVVFFLWFFAMACLVKLLSVWLGARLAGETPASALHLAVALNARGGPGIVLATVTFGAGIINETFFTALVLLAVLSSQLAGFWLDQVLRKPSSLQAALLGLVQPGRPGAETGVRAAGPAGSAAKAGRKERQG